MLVHQTIGKFNLSVLLRIRRNLRTSQKRMTNTVKGDIPCSQEELRLDITLACGQSFRWKENIQGKWFGVLDGKLWILHQDKAMLYYEVILPVNQDTIESSLAQHELQSHCEAFIRDYFQLNLNLKELYKQWSVADENFKEKAIAFNGVRMLRQDPIENLFSFICSSNNHISRISGMVERMCETFGEKLVTYEDVDYYSFPTVETLSRAEVENKLRSLGFGYRAKYIQESAKYISQNHSEDWLQSLRNIPYPEAKKELVKLSGVGSKVPVQITNIDTYFN